MSLSHRLQKLREKPAHVKNRIAITWVVVIGVCIIVIWFATFNFRGFDLHSAGDFFRNTKTYFSESQGEIFNADSPVLLEAIGIATSTATNTAESENITASTTASSTNTELVQ